MFIILPVGMNYRTERLPIVTFSLMAANVLVYLVSLPFELTQGPEATGWIFEHLWLIPSLSTWYTYFTAMFVHAGFFHLLGNMIYLFLFGCCVEDLIGRGRFLALYLASGVVAEFAYVAFSPEHFASEIPMGGASGAISACMGAYLVLRTHVDIDFRYFLLFFFRVFSGEFSVPAWLVISFWFLKDLFFAGLTYYTAHGHGGVAFGAHVGGFLSGLALAGLNKLIQTKTATLSKGPMRLNLPARPQPVLVETHNEPATIFLYDGKSEFGPFNLFQVQQMLAERRINLSAQYWSEGMTEWRSVAELN